MVSQQGMHFVRPESRRYRPLSEDEYARLRDSIAAIGLMHPILLFEGAVLDGAHRLQACEDLGVEPKFLDVTGVGDPAQILEACNATQRLDKPRQIALFKYEQPKPAVSALPAAELTERTTNLCRSELSTRQASRGWWQELPYCYAHMRDAIPPLIFGFFLMALMVIGGIIDS